MRRVSFANEENSPVTDAEMEVCHVVLDRPRFGDPSALMYVALAPASHGGQPIATSAVFHPHVDSTANRQALADLQTSLEADGWQPDESRAGLVGLRFYRRRSAH
jgi:hypothetical protein